MDQQVQQPLVARGRFLLLTLLAAFVWLLLSIVTGGTSAVADDSVDEGGGLLGSLTSTVEEVVPVTTVTETLNEIAEPLVEPLTPVVESLAPVVEALEPVLRQPLIDDTVNLLSDLVKDSTDALAGVESSDPPVFAEALPLAATAHEPGPAAVKVTAVTPDTRAASVPAAGSLSSPDAPAAPAPVAPTPAPAPTLGQTSGALALVASLGQAGGPLALAVASAASVDFALPCSPTFDNDTSPD